MKKARFNKLCFSLSLGFIIQSLAGIAQETDFESFTISAQILDKNSTETIPYATVYNRRNSKGTISNLEGFFVLRDLQSNDTLQISFVGYDQKIIVVNSNSDTEKIYLKKKTENLGEVVITADDSYLYELVAECKKSRPKQTYTAKTYFMLSSEIGEKQTELVEGYYNGTFTGYDTDEIALKNGRIALAEFNQRYFLSTESSKSLIKHHLFDQNPNFPLSPFQYSLAKLKKNYTLNLASIYLEGDENIYVIDFIPIDTGGDYFSGSVYINSKRKKILKVNLAVTNAGRHPFLPIVSIDSLKQVDLQIAKTYAISDAETKLQSIDFNYKIHYKSADSLREEEFVVNTNSVLYPYDYKELFLLPQFEFTSSDYEDYRKVNATPYNAFFWDNIDEFKMKDLTNRGDDFIENHSTLSKREIFAPKVFTEKGLFEHSYAFWSETRIHFREDIGEDGKKKAQLGTIPAEQYNLVAQIYLDVNFLNDSLNVLTEAVFDPFKSYYYFPLTNTGRAFINMYFDLVEMQRREIAANLNGKHSIQEVLEIYNKGILELEHTTRAFFKDVDHGTKTEEMKRWNDIIINGIGIDNMRYFNIEEVTVDGKKVGEGDK